MRKLIILILALIPFISSCKKDKEADSNMQIREIAWNSLTEQSKSTVIIDWKQAPVTESTYNQKSVYAVVFKTSDDALLGPITVYVDILTKEVLGQALRD
ncbi:MAG: hypothetical protein F9K37_02000 [Bacteroidales bacterium]|nr:MAG: hypothetical protein F9K37_02000 [Bacteroidales bacterium]